MKIKEKFHNFEIKKVMENEKRDTRFQKGNRLWELAETTGRPKIYETPEQLWSYCTEYFVWCENNPLYEKQFHGKDAIECTVPKMRAMTIQGLCVFLGIDITTFYAYEKLSDFSKIIARIRNVIWTQKFEGASAGLLNANIIARELGLAEKVNQNIKVGLDSENSEEYE